MSRRFQILVYTTFGAGLGYHGAGLCHKVHQWNTSRLHTNAILAKRFDEALHLAPKTAGKDWPQPP